MDYESFIAAKRHSAQNFGIDANYLPDGMFDYQKYVTEYAVKKGRCAVFLDTGLGKTLIEIATSVNYAKHTNKPVLIITPLAVAFQFIKEAETRFSANSQMSLFDGAGSLDDMLFDQ